MDKRCTMILNYFSKSEVKVKGKPCKIIINAGPFEMVTISMQYHFIWASLELDILKLTSKSIFFLEKSLRADSCVQPAFSWKHIPWYSQFILFIHQVFPPLFLQKETFYLCCGKVIFEKTPNLIVLLDYILNTMMIP